MSYPAPVYLFRNEASAAATGKTVDIGDANPGCPPVMHLIISNTATVVVEGSHDLTDGGDYSCGGLSATTARDLIPGVRFWRARITANTGTVTVSIGGVNAPDGSWHTVRELVTENNATLVA